MNILSRSKLSSAARWCPVPEVNTVGCHYNGCHYNGLGYIVHSIIMDRDSTVICDSLPYWMFVDITSLGYDAQNLTEHLSTF